MRYFDVVNREGGVNVNLMSARRRVQSRKPDEAYEIIEACRPGPFLELFARERRAGWTQWGDELAKEVEVVSS